MKIAIYGVSGSGKDYLITQAVEYLASKGCPAVHVRGSETLNEMAQRLHGVRFGELREDVKMGLRASFPVSLESKEFESGNVFVDGHFAFLNEYGDVYSVCTDVDLATYDLFFYLDTSPDVVSQRLREERNKHVNPESLSKLREFEIAGLTERLLSIGKELHVIKNDGEATLRYIHETIMGMHSSLRIARALLSKAGELSGCGVVAVVDCDKTLIREDSTSLLLKQVGIDGNGLNSIYALDRYTNYQDFMARLWLRKNADYSKLVIDQVCKDVTPNEGLVRDLQTVSNVSVLALSAGDSRIWERLLAQLEIDARLLTSAEGMSKYVKYHVVKELQKNGKFVVAIGDSMLDALMLGQADRAYIAAEKGYRSSIANLLAANPGIRQLRYSAHQYDGVCSDASICWIRSIGHANQAASRDMATCKSSSGAWGKELRSAHYRLGLEVGRIIAESVPEESFATVIMMRSGLPFGQGITDALDCPEFFQCGDDNLLVQEIRSCGCSDRTLIIVDGVINTGATMTRTLESLEGMKVIVASNVISSKCKIDAAIPVFAARVSDNSFKGARQWQIFGGRGPDTSDRLFATM